MHTIQIETTIVYTKINSTIIRQESSHTRMRQIGLFYKV